VDKYSAWDAREELCDLEGVLLEKANMFAKSKDSYELARMLVVMNKEVYRYEEEARKLRLTGELNWDTYEELISRFYNVKRKIFDVVTQHKLNSDVSRLFKIMRFSNEVAGLYLTEYLEEVGVQR